jgi:hypothetical protein
MVGHARNGQPISQFLPGTADNHQFKTVIARAGGCFSMLIFVQGHGDSAADTPRSVYLRCLSAIMRDFEETYGQFKSAFCSIPSLTANSEGGSLAVDAIRTAHLDFVAAARSRAYVAGLDATLDYTTAPSGVHPDQAGDLILARHFYRAFGWLLGFDPIGDDGPGVVSVNAHGQFIELMIRHAGGTALVGTGRLACQAGQFKVFRSGEITEPLSFDAVNPIDMSLPDRIRLKLADPLAEGVAVDVWYRMTPDTPEIVASGVYDNNVDDNLPLGRQLAFFAGPIRARAAP